MNSPGNAAALAFVRRALITAAILAAAFIAWFLFTASVRVSISVAAGAGIAMASFAVLALVSVRALAGGRGASWLAVLGIVKMGLIGALLWWLLSRGIVEPLAFLGGFSTMVAALVIEGIRMKR